MPCWVVVADGSQARIFSRQSAQDPLSEKESFDNSVARLKASEILTDQAGRSMQSFGGGARSGMELQTDPAELEEDRFAHRLAEHLGKAAHLNEFQSLVLIAAPRFLGSLRQEITPLVKTKIVGEMPKNLKAMGAAEIQKHLDDADFAGPEQ